MNDGIMQVGLPAKNVVNYDACFSWGRDQSGSFVRGGWKMGNYDYIILDEAQDFSREDIDILKSKVNKAFLIYGDTAQQLYKFLKGKVTVSMEDIQYFTKYPIEQLVFNHRLPKKIARLAKYLNSENDELEERCTEEGTEKPKILQYQTIEAQYDAIISLIQNKNMEDVGILFRHNEEVERAYNYFKNHGMNVEAKYGRFMDLDFTKLMTYHSSKGLQFEHVFLPECTVEGEEDRNPLYVAITRSYRALYIMHSGNLNSLDMAVTLHSKYPVFQVNDADLENYPMVIEIDTDDYEPTNFNLSGSNNGIETYTCASTIYLNPFHCFIYFDSYEARQGVLTKAKQSLENKFSKLYSPNLRIWRHEAKGTWSKVRDLFAKTEQTVFLWNATYAPTKAITCSDKRDDAYIDRLKGFLYCYLIGANLSVSKEIGELKAIAKVLRNTLSAVINSPERRPTEKQDDILVENIKRFNAIFKEKDETAKQNKEKIVYFLKQNPLGISIEESVRFLEYCNVYNDFCNKLHLSPIYDANDLWTSVEYVTQDAYTMALDKLNRAVLQVEASEHSKKEKKHLANLIQVDANKHIHIIDPSFTHEFYEKLVQSLL